MTANPGFQLTYELNVMEGTTEVLLHGGHLHTTDMDVGLSEKGDTQTWTLCKQRHYNENFISFTCNKKFDQIYLNLLVKFHDNSDASLCEIQV